MIGFPNAKINIGLRITGKFPDGYHEIKSLMIPTGFCDVLEFLPASSNRLTITGIEVPGDPEDNILWKTLRILRKDHFIPPLNIHLHKCIPAGAGLGGGSADASFFINMLNDFFSLGLSIASLESIAAGIGSDCPFFIRNQPSLITGRGEIIHPCAIELKHMFLLILYPGFSISTAEAYSGVKISKETTPLEELLKMDIYQWKGKVMNDFENNLFSLYPLLDKIKSELYQTGAVYASMSGSGSAVYGIFREKPQLTPGIMRMVIYEGEL